METALLSIGMVLTGATVIYLVGSLIRSIQSERKSAGIKKIWSNFGLGIALAILFFTTWLAQGLVQWVDFVNDQKAHGEPVIVSDFVAEFGQATLENWQSEFLQLFSFVVLAAVLIHRGSAESRDSDDRMERKIDEIKQMLQERRS